MEDNLLLQKHQMEQSDAVNRVQTSQQGPVGGDPGVGGVCTLEAAGVQVELTLVGSPHWEIGPHWK